GRVMGEGEPKSLECHRRCGTARATTIGPRSETGDGTRGAGATCRPDARDLPGPGLLPKPEAASISAPSSFRAPVPPRRRPRGARAGRVGDFRLKNKCLRAKPFIPPGGPAITRAPARFPTL